MSWKQALALIGAAILGGVAGSAALLGFLIVNPSLSLRLIPSASAATTPTGPVAKTVTARRFVLVDDKGNPRAILGTHADTTVLILSDKAGKPRAVLLTEGDATGLNLYDRAGKSRAFLFTKGAYTGLDLYDKAGKRRAELDTKGDGTGLFLADKTGKMRAALGNTDLKHTRTGSTEHRAISSLVLFNEKGGVLWKAP